MMHRLLPNNRTPLEAALANAMQIDLGSDVVKDVTDPSDIPTEWIPWLAWALSLSDEEGWQLAESEDAQRDLMRRAVEIHRTKGSVWSIRELFRTLRLGEVDIIENVGRLRYDGSKHHHGLYVYGGGDGVWATYKVILRQPITNDQAANVIRMLEGIAPRRSQLISLEYQAVAIRYNGVARFDALYNYGSAV